MPVSVPVTVTGLPDTVRMLAGKARPTLVTVPPDAGLAHDVFPEPSVLSTKPFVPLPTGRLNVVLPAAALTPIAAEPVDDPFSVREPPVPYH